MRNSIPELRREHGWSQQKLATLLGVSRQTVISLEKGHFNPSLPVAFNLAALFGCLIEDIFVPDD